MIKNLLTLIFVFVYASANLFTHNAHAHNTPTHPIITQETGFNEERYHRLIAQWSLQQLNGSVAQIFDPWVLNNLYRISAQMNAHVRPQSLLATPIIIDKNINAFAVVGGLIAINTGTLLTANSLDESASVLAHEIAHLSLRHHERRQDNQGKLVALQLGGLLAAIAATSVDGDGAAALLIGSQTLAAEHAATHSRTHEREADRVGMQILVKSGFDGRAMPAFFERLHRQASLNQHQNTFIPSFVRTHPLTHERLSEAHLQARQYQPHTPNIAHEQLFDLLTWRIKYLAKQTDFKELSTAAHTSLGAKLALIAFLADNNRTTEAWALWQSIEKLPEQQRSDPLFCITKAHIAYEQKDFVKATKILTPCHAIYPERKDLPLYLADAQFFAGDYLGAEKLLNRLVNHNTSLGGIHLGEANLVAWNLLQKIYEQRSLTHTDTNKHQADILALRTRAKQELWRGQYQAALNSLTTAQALAQAHHQDGLITLLEQDKKQVQTYQKFTPK